jgi:glycosyltransferase involved in cell wall biosynthesis
MAAALFVDPRSEASIAAAMQRILQDEALRRRLSDAGRLRAARFTWAESARQVYALLCAELALA